MILKEFSFFDVLVVSIAGKHEQTDKRPVVTTELFRDDKSDCGRFVIKNNKQMINKKVQEEPQAEVAANPKTGRKRKSDTD